MLESERITIRLLDQHAVLHLKSCAPESTHLIGPSTFDSRAHVLPLGPGEWLFVSQCISQDRLHEMLRDLTPTSGLSAVSVSSGIKVLRVEGWLARELLSKGCGLDLHADSFPAGRVARTRFASVSVIVRCADPEGRFDLYFGRSYCTYLRSWLEDAAAEFR
jgi:sarcosine oxidase subunit gamma